MARFTSALLMLSLVCTRAECVLYRCVIRSFHACRRFFSCVGQPSSPFSYNERESKRERERDRKERDRDRDRKERRKVTLRDTRSG